MFHKNANSSHGILVQTVYLDNYVEEAEVNSSQCFSNLSRKWVIFLPSSNIRAFILLEVGTQLASKNQAFLVGQASLFATWKSACDEANDSDPLRHNDVWIWGRNQKLEMYAFVSMSSRSSMYAFQQNGNKSQSFIDVLHLSRPRKTDPCTFTSERRGESC